MGNMQIIMRTERRRKWSDADRTRLLAECDEPGTTVREVARRHDIAESLLYSWRSARRQKQAIASQPLGFVGYGAIADSSEDLVNPVAATPATPARGMSEVPLWPEPDQRHPYPGERPGAIELLLPTGTRLTVDTYINERALMRVLSALMDAEARERQIKRRMGAGKKAGDKPHAVASECTIRSRVRPGDQTCEAVDADR